MDQDVYEAVVGNLPGTDAFADSVLELARDLQIANGSEPYDVVLERMAQRFGTMELTLANGSKVTVSKIKVILMYTDKFLEQWGAAKLKQFFEQPVQLPVQQPYIGWQDTNNAEQETATYATTGGTLTTKINKTIYAVYAINDMTIKFTYWSGNGYATDTTTIKYDDGTRSDTGAARYVTTGRLLDTEPIDHADQTNHYYFTGWAIESGTATLTQNTSGTKKSATISKALTDVNVQAKYQGVSHHWVTVIDDDHPYVEPTCTEDGYFYHYCSDCGYEDYHAVIPATGHEMSFEGYKAPTCTKDGKYAIAVCNRCGLKSTDDGYGAAKYYDYVNGNYVAVDAEDRAIPALGHDWAASEVVEDSYSFPSGVTCPNGAEHGLTYTLNKDDRIYHVICSDCGKEFDVDADFEYGHTVYTCTRCGETYVESNKDSGGLFEAIGDLIGDGIRWIVDKLRQLVEQCFKPFGSDHIADAHLGVHRRRQSRPLGKNRLQRIIQLL